MQLGSYWFETDTPTFLVELLKGSKYNLQRFTCEMAPSDSLNGIDSMYTNPVPILYQSGYLTIKDFDKSFLELHYQNVLFIVFKLLGFYTQVEYHTSNGRIDMIVKADKYIYVMEFKLNRSAEEAIKQINENGYASPFVSDARKLYKVGVNFSNEIRGIEEWIVE